jgi:hypothetical protein
MKKILLSLIAPLFSIIATAQCPDLLQAMVNSCGSTEGNNEFVVFTTTTAAAASTYTLNYGSSNPPTTNNLAGTDASAKTGTGSVVSSAGCSVIEVTNPATIIPAGTRVIFIPSTLDQQYNVTGLCDGANPLYVVYIKINTAGGTNSNWNTGGTMANSATTYRYLQITYSGSAACNGTTAPLKDYLAVPNWPITSSTGADGNFVRWTDTVATYYNNGCTEIILPVKLVNLFVSFSNNTNMVQWQTSEEINTANFIVEKSYDGKNFISATTIPAAGQSSTLQSYRFADQAVQFRPTYYRIKTIDRNGQFDYSKIVRINPSGKSFSVGNIYPNPASESVYIEWNSAIKNRSQMQVIDMSGRVVRQQNINSIAGFNKQYLNVASLSSGRYIIKIISAEDIVIDSFTK